jgi:hypothetical protein
MIFFLYDKVHDSTHISKNRDIGISHMTDVMCLLLCLFRSHMTLSTLRRRFISDGWHWPLQRCGGFFCGHGGHPLDHGVTSHRDPQRSTDAKRFIDSFPTRRYAWQQCEAALGIYISMEDMLLLNLNHLGISLQLQFWGCWTATQNFGCFGLRGTLDSVSSHTESRQF